MAVSRTRLQHNFSRAAMEYDHHAQFQQIQTSRVLDAALMLLPPSARIADIGCGTAYFAHIAQSQRPDWQIIGIDISLGMCAVAQSRCAVMAGDAVRLPLADGVIDAAVSALCYQWVEDIEAAFVELARVLRPGGRAIIASLGAETLQELRHCASMVQLPLAMLPMRETTAVTQALHRCGLEVMLADTRRETLYYPNVSALLNSMRKIGAGHNFDPNPIQNESRPPHSASQFIRPKRWAAMVHEYEKQRIGMGIPATWEQQFFVLHKPL